MVASRKLSTDEVNALLEGLEASTSSQGGVAVDLSESSDVRQFSFGSDDLSVLGDYHALRMINERFARFSRAVFLPMLRIQPRISSFPPEVKTFDEYTSEIDNFMSLTTVRIEELRGSMLMVFDPGFISKLTDSYYGGTLTKTVNAKAEFTATEDRLIEILTRGLNEVLENSWRDLMPVTFKEQGREVNPQFASFVDGTDTVIICSFVVQLPNIDPATFQIIYPLQTLKPIASQLRSRIQSEIIDDDVTWRDRLERAVLDIPLLVDVLLAEPKIALSNLIHIKPGDVLPVQLAESVDIRLEENPFFEGEMGDVAGQLAVNLTKRLDSHSA